jgi:hypothetical protein
MASAEAWQGLELVHEAGPAGVTGDEVIGPVEADGVVELLVELFSVELLEEDEELVEELLMVLVGNESDGVLDGATDVVVVVADVTEGRAERQVQTA